MPQDKHHNTLYSGGFPVAVGDRHHAQDKFRDFDYLRDKIGAILQDISTGIPVLLKGGQVTKGTGDTLDITPATGYVPFDVTTPDDMSTLPGSTLTATLRSVRVESTQQNNLAIGSATLDGSTVNYVKLAYAEVTAGNTRSRAKAAGSYDYEQSPSFTITVDSTPPTSDEIQLDTFTGTAGEEDFIFSGARTASPMESQVVEMDAAPFDIADGEAVSVTSKGQIFAGHGKPYFFTGQAGPITNASAIDICDLDGQGRWAVAVIDADNSERGDIYIATMTATGTFTFGAVQTFETDACVPFSPNDGSANGLLRVFAPEPDVVIVVWRDDTNNVTEIRAGTVSGDTVTYGTPQNLHGGTDTRAGDLTVLDQNKYAFIFIDIAGTTLTGNIIDRTPGTTTLAVGTDQASADDATQNLSMKIVRVTDTSFVVGYSPDTAEMAIQAATVSGTTITWGGEVSFTTTTTGTREFDVIAMQSATKGIGYCSAEAADSIIARAFTIAGNAVTMVAGENRLAMSNVNFPSDRPGAERMMPFAGGPDDTRYLVLHSDKSSSDEVAAIEIRTDEASGFGNPRPFDGFSANATVYMHDTYLAQMGAAFPVPTTDLSFGNGVFACVGIQANWRFSGATRIQAAVWAESQIGIADEAISAGERGRVIVHGVKRGLSGLVPGAWYYADDDGALQTEQSERPIGVALTEDSIFVIPERAPASYDTGWISGGDYTLRLLGSDANHNVDSDLVHNLGRAPGGLDVQLIFGGNTISLRAIDNVAAEQQVLILESGTANSGAHLSTPAVLSDGSARAVLRTGTGGVGILQGNGTTVVLAGSDRFYRIRLSRKDA